MMKDEGGRRKDEGGRCLFISHPSSFLLLTVIIVLVFAAIGISSPLMTLYFEALGADYRHISLIMASAAVISLLSNYLWGRVSDRLGRYKPLIVAGLTAAALAYFLLSRVASPELAWAVRLWQALALAAYTTTSLAFMGDLVSSQRGQRMGTYRGIGSLAFAVGAVIGGRVADRFSLRLTFVVCAGFYVLAAFTALALREARVVPADRQQAPGTSGSARHLSNFARLPWLFLIGVALWSAAWYAQASLWPNFMATLGYSKTTISSLWGLAALIEAPSMRWIGHFSDIAGRVPVLAASGLGAAVVMAGYIWLARWLAPLLGIQLIRGLTFASLTATAMTYATETGDARTRGRHSGMYNAAAGAGQLLGLLMSGPLAQARGFEVMFGVCAGMALLGGVCFLALGRGILGPRAVAR
jgi:MFS family permease